MKRHEIKLGQKVVILDRNQVVLDNVKENGKRVKQIKGIVVCSPYKVSRTYYAEIEIEGTNTIKAFPISRIELSKSVD
jgi:predicted TIM-barrel enzyme